MRNVRQGVSEADDPRRSHPSTRLRRQPSPPIAYVTECSSSSDLRRRAFPGRPAQGAVACRFPVGPRSEERLSQSMLLSGLAQQTPSELPIYGQNSSVSLPSSRLAIPTRPPKATLDRRVLATAAIATAAPRSRPAVDDAEHRGVLQRDLDPRPRPARHRDAAGGVSPAPARPSSAAGDMVPHVRFLALDTDGGTAEGRPASATSGRSSAPPRTISAKLQRAESLSRQDAARRTRPTEEWLAASSSTASLATTPRRPVRQLGPLRASPSSLPGDRPPDRGELQAVHVRRHPPRAEPNRRPRHPHRQRAPRRGDRRTLPKPGPPRRRRFPRHRVPRPQPPPA